MAELRLGTEHEVGDVQNLALLIPLIVRSRKERQERRHFEEAKRKQAEIEALTARGQGFVDESETVKTAEPIKRWPPCVDIHLPVRIGIRSPKNDDIAFKRATN